MCRKLAEPVNARVAAIRKLWEVTACLSCQAEGMPEACLEALGLSQQIVHILHEESLSLSLFADWPCAQHA